MDGRVQEPVFVFGRNKFGVKYADTITEAGLVGLFAKKDIDEDLLNSLKNKIFISLAKHHSKGIVVHGHAECAGNPVEDRKHKEDVQKSVKLIKSFVPHDIPVLPVFVERGNEGWKVEPL